MGNINLSEMMRSLGTGERGHAEFALAVAVSLFYALAYRLIYQERRREPNEALARSFLFLAPATTAVFWVIQYSLPLSLGLLGALSFVRFRTPVKSAEDVAFILLVIASSLSCAVYRFGVAGILCTMILLVIWGEEAFIRWRRWGFRRKASLFLSFARPDAGDGARPKIEDLILKWTGRPGALVHSSMSEGRLNLHFSLEAKAGEFSTEAFLGDVRAAVSPERLDFYVDCD